MAAKFTILVVLFSALALPPISADEEKNDIYSATLAEKGLETPNISTRD